KRPQDRIELGLLDDKFKELFSTPVSEGGYGRQQFDLEKRYEVTLCGDGRHPVASGGLQDPKSVPLPVLNDSTAANTSVQT
ncbi:hypothetical protein OFN64_39435, partial [Escherichia coli]|nr:hypothetical protein [Escherichia coli]